MAIWRDGRTGALRSSIFPFCLPWPQRRFPVCLVDAKLVPGPCEAISALFPPPPRRRGGGGRGPVLRASQTACAVAHPPPRGPAEGVPRDAGGRNAATPCAPGIARRALCAWHRVCMGRCCPTLFNPARCACEGQEGAWGRVAAGGRLRPTAGLRQHIQFHARCSHPLHRRCCGWEWG